MPNWKVDSEYEFPKKLDDNVWAWEFLRRNESYRQSWISLQAEIKPLIEKYGPLASWPQKEPGDDAWIFTPPKLAVESLQAWQSRIVSETDASPTRMHIHRARAAEWRLGRMVDPDSTPANEVEFLASFVPIWHRLEDIERGGTPGHEENRTGAYVWINLDAPIVTQVDIAKTKLRQLQSKLVNSGVLESGDPRSQREKWPDYLQIFDATKAGATPTEIASMLKRYKEMKNEYPDYHAKNLVSDRLKQARRMIDAGYLALIV
jgi:hypothetical protein